MPAVGLAEMILPSPVAVPPIVTPGVPLTTTPKDAVPQGRVPVKSVPMRLPRITTPVVAVPAIDTPACPLAEITLPTPCAAPPMVTPKASSTDTPEPELGRGLVPVSSVPM